MKRTGMIAALALALALTGCAARREEQRFETWQRSLAGAGAIAFRAQIIDRQGEAETDFTVAVERCGAETAYTVTAPETIAGITYRQHADGDTLEFDGVILELGPGRGDGLSPCGAGGVFLDALAGGHLLYTGRDGEMLTAELTAPGGETVTVWRTEGNIPVYAELGRDGAAWLSLYIDDWQIEE